MVPIAMQVSKSTEKYVKLLVLIFVQVSKANEFYFLCLWKKYMNALAFIFM